MTALPTGTVTFLFTDIEGSTKLAQQYRDQWENLRARHHAILQQAMQSHDGHVFQIIGDAFCVAFHTAMDAVKAAVDAQKMLHQEAWDPAPVKVRMGIHSGTAQTGMIEDQSGGYSGYTTLARTQRLMSAGHGGQVLISLVTEELVGDELPDEITLRDLGARRLKDLIRPEHIYQLVIPDLPSDFPPIKTLDAYRHNLPTQMTSFIGRQKEMVEVVHAISEHRLVTLTGSGGTGKTRLALQVAADLLDQFTDGVWFVELAPLTNPDLIPQVILSAFGIPEQKGRTSLQTVLDYVCERQLLIILDNCEHLIEACARLADNMLNHAHGLKILATGREPLGVAGELDWMVPSLSMPDPKHALVIESISQYEAVRLFIERAMLAQPRFYVTKDNVPAIAEICSRLDGIPLALELAAARMRALSVHEIAERLDDCFRLLTGGVRTALPRQQTLRATIDWSYDLLSAQEKILLRRLAIFSGSWTLEAAEQVCFEEGNECDILDSLMHLVERSLVNTEEFEGRTRYYLLETTRQYAHEKLIESREHETTHLKHLNFFLQFAEDAESHLLGPDQVLWLDRLEREHHNFRTALKWSIQTGRGEEASRMAGALGIFWWKHTHYSEGRKWFRDILESQLSSSDLAQIKAWRWAGFLAFFQLDMADAHHIYSRNLEREQALGDQWGVAFSLHMLANIAYFEGDMEKVKKLHEESMALSRAIDAPWVLAMAQFSLGYPELTWGNLALAEGLFGESLEHFRHLGDKWGIATVLENLGFLMCSKKDFPAAKKFFLESLELFKELGDIDGMSMDLTGLASILQSEGEYISCARLQGVVIAKEREYGLSLQPVEKESFDTTASALKEIMGAQEYQKELEIGMAITLEEAVSLVSG